MHNTIISDTSCLIVLTNIQELDLLNKVYGQIITTSEVLSEYGQQLPDWFKIIDPKDVKYLKVLELEIDKGEASAILLALELGDATVILDDYKARKVAVKLGLTITGTLGIILKAKRQEIISSIK